MVPSYGASLVEFGRHFLLILRSGINIKGENMATKIFVNLPVKNLNKSIEFFTKLGYKFK